MIKTKRKSSIYYPIKEYYKRRLMVGDILTNRTLYIDFQDSILDVLPSDEGTPYHPVMYINNKNNNGLTYNYGIHYLHDPYTSKKFTVYIGKNRTLSDSTIIYSYDLSQNKLLVDNKIVKVNSDFIDVYQISNKSDSDNIVGRIYRCLYIKDPKIRSLKVGDTLKNGTKLYFNIPDNITKLFSEYKYTSSTRSKVRSKTPILKAAPSTDPTTDTLINKFLKVTYYPDGTERRASVTNLILTDGSSNIDIFKATYNQSNFYKPEINISIYTVTNTTVISNYNEFDFWSQFILVDETTL